MQNSATHPSAASRPWRRRYWWPLWAALSFPLFALMTETLWPKGSFIWFGFECLLIGPWIGWAAWSAARAAMLGLHRQWPRASVMAVFPLCAAIVWTNTDSLSHGVLDLGDSLHFYLWHADYVRRLEALPNDGRKLAMFDLGGMIWAGRGILYDETDEVMLPTEKQSADWKARAQNTELFCGAATRPLLGPIGLRRHWYLSSFWC